MDTILFSFSPIVFGLSGLILALYIFITKKNKTKPLVCPIGGHCAMVVHSKYSKLFGLPVELLGAIYYFLITSFYTINFFVPGLFPDSVLFLGVFLSVLAFFFSVYLVFVQAFALKNWCTWCLFSAGFTTFIAIVSVFGASFHLPTLLAEYKGLIVILHALSAAIGVGATTVTDVLFFKFLKDFKISDSEKNIMDTMSHIIWVALGLLIITGIGLYVPRGSELLGSSKFLVKMVAVGVITLNGLVLNFVVSPRLTSLVFGKAKDVNDTSSEHVYRKISFASGAISISSWYTVFILGSLRSIPVSFSVGLWLYVAILCVAIVGSQIYDKKLSKQKQNTY